MADDTKDNEQNLDLRESLNNAYAFIEGQKSVNAFATVTIEDMLDQQIERLSGDSLPTKKNAIDTINYLESQVVVAVAKIKELPDDTFQKQRSKDNVNTPVAEREDNSFGERVRKAVEAANNQ